jgi:hypothetical protein
MESDGKQVCISFNFKAEPAPGGVDSANLSHKGASVNEEVFSAVYSRGSRV